MLERIKDWAIALLVVSIVLIIAIACHLYDIAHTDTTIRTMEATAISKTYHEQGDYTSMTFRTTDGNEWVYDYTVCPIGAKCTITFDTQGTDMVEDDIITSIMCELAE